MLNFGRGLLRLGRGNVDQTLQERDEVISYESFAITQTVWVRLWSIVYGSRFECFSILKRRISRPLVLQWGWIWWHFQSLVLYLYFLLFSESYHIWILFVELWIGKGETSNDPQEKYRIDEVGHGLSFILVPIFLAIPVKCWRQQWYNCHMGTSFNSRRRKAKTSVAILWFKKWQYSDPNQQTQFSMENIIKRRTSCHYRKT